jgi:hypothetical protein
LQPGSYTSSTRLSENRKINALRRSGLTWRQIEVAAAGFTRRLEAAHIRGIVLDFDGTCCETVLRKTGMPTMVSTELVRLLRQSMPIAYATGRGQSLYNNLRAQLPSDLWPRVLMGCHSGSTRVCLADAWPGRPADEDLNAMVSQLEKHGIAEGTTYEVRPRSSQLSIRCKEPHRTLHVFLVAQNFVSRRPGWRVFRSAHSVDVLTPGAGKLGVVDWLASRHRVDVASILRIGDRGEAFGNDSELLDSGLSLSVDGVSANPQSCWSFHDGIPSPSHRLAEFLRALELSSDGAFRVNPNAVSAWHAQTRQAIATARGGTA